MRYLTHSKEMMQVSVEYDLFFPIYAPQMTYLFDVKDNLRISRPLFWLGEHF